MKQVTIHNPQTVIFGSGCIKQLTEYYIENTYKRIYILSIEPMANLLQEQLSKLKKAGIEYTLNTSLKAEPSFSEVKALIDESRAFAPDSILGIGGGSVLDVAKLLAVFLKDESPLEKYVGMHLIPGRQTHLVCVPTTSGTGSEMSPNSILLDDSDTQKKGIISKHLVPDATYIDPDLTVGLPADLTAYTGVDALTHCIEAYANNFAHPVIDQYALSGIKLIGESLAQACENPKDIEARSKLALGSMYGGMCLGPVNTAAVHALAYPLGSDYKIAHGLSNALLLPYVLEFNLEATPERYAEIASALGAEKGNTDTETARNGLTVLTELLKKINIPAKLSDIGVEESNIDQMAQSAMKVQRLLKNNVREVNLQDAINIYSKAF